MMTTRRPLALLAACALVSLTASLSMPAMAGGDIVKCVAADGRVTLTDRPCEQGDASVIMAAATPAPRADINRINRVALIAAPVPVRPVEHDTWVSPHPFGKQLSRDAATLRAARTSLQVLDEAAGSARQQRLAGLN